MQTAHVSLNTDFATRAQLLEQQANHLALAGLIDHTLLKVDVREADLSLLLDQARQHRFRAICVSGSALEFLQREIKACRDQRNFPQICTVVGFPHGNNVTKGKVSEVIAGLEHGADEFDYVQNISWVKDGRWKQLTAEAEKIVVAAKGKLVKVILETSLLTEEEILQSATAAAYGGVHVLKTSTGFSSRGASKADLELLTRVTTEHERNCGIRLGIKASGGIRSLSDALAMVQLGATRLGTSAGVALVSGQQVQSRSTY